MTRYTVTYSFEGYPHAQHRNPVTLIAEAVAEMQQSGTDIAFLGATREFDPSGAVIQTTARYSASNKGTIGRLNCRARLPACGSPQRRRIAESDSADSRSAVTG